MPLTKNAFIRYKFLDKLLSDHHHYYDIHDLTDRVNDMLVDNGFEEVGQRCIEKDLKTLEYAPFNAPIKRFRKSGKRCITYGSSSFSIFSKEMGDEESDLLREVLSTIGQFDGLDNFRWLDNFKIGLGIEERRQIICFSNNPYLKNSNLLGTLFDNISNEVVIRLTYQPFWDSKERIYDFHPYLLKQYNDRWYLLGATDDKHRILTLALDRIVKVEPQPEKRYIKCPEDFSERFDDIIGVSLYEGRPVEHIVFWMDDKTKDYIITKPIHGSQTLLKGEMAEQLKNKYPQLEGGAFFTIDCIRNNELTRVLTSYGQELLVLSPDSIVSELYGRAMMMAQEYYEIIGKDNDGD